MQKEQNYLLLLKKTQPKIHVKTSFRFHVATLLENNALSLAMLSILDIIVYAS
jgi:hypothetical protein